LSQKPVLIFSKTAASFFIVFWPDWFFKKILIPCAAIFFPVQGIWIFLKNQSGQKTIKNDAAVFEKINTGF
jgi:hypothetical protein